MAMETRMSTDTDTFLQFAFVYHFKDQPLYTAEAVFDQIKQLGPGFTPLLNALLLYRVCTAYSASPPSPPFSSFFLFNPSHYTK